MTPVGAVEALLFTCVCSRCIPLRTPQVFLLNGPWVVLPVVLGRRALRAVREAQAGDRERFGALASPRGVVGCLNSDKWS